jgi:hypothetical protein
VIVLSLKWHIFGSGPMTAKTSTRIEYHTKEHFGTLKNIQKQHHNSSTKKINQ